MVFEEGKREIERLKQNGYELILLTGAPYFIAENFKILGFDLIISCELEARNDKFIGELIRYTGAKMKKDIVLNLSKELSLDLSLSRGYGNSYEDREFLSLTEFPFAVNPSFKFRNFAKNGLENKELEVDLLHLFFGERGRSRGNVIGLPLF